MHSDFFKQKKIIESYHRTFMNGFRGVRLVQASDSKEKNIHTYNQFYLKLFQYKLYFLWSVSLLFRLTPVVSTVAPQKWKKNTYKKFHLDLVRKKLC